ncbi:WhiB family transcriptional regulator [Kutzneria kofuensis]|uniref:WhiB family redox-sensing transcriptional regulator n=1 Tax=Kutzneria kofuensis TaxID=103725 RepID=A0A7W9KBT1_9PSEU|nr:WhiB family transcriptional regulator [Kutzneria kofuensis]MBB5889682.1 WhiB family redox-sensing transcriptional regulator [Kutzneria kofuensis]
MVAWQLDRLRWVPDDVLSNIVRDAGTCMFPTTEDEPTGNDDYVTDRQLAARLCAGCPAQDECLELELRTAGEHTVGVWGGLTDDDRRALHWHWRQRGERAEGGSQ